MDSLLALSSLHSSKKAAGSAKERAEVAKQLADDLQDAWWGPTLGSGKASIAPGNEPISHVGKRKIKQVIFQKCLVGGHVKFPRRVVLLGFLTGFEL